MENGFRLTEKGMKISDFCFSGLPLLFAFSLSSVQNMSDIHDK